jgi:hypothetical protein
VTVYVDGAMIQASVPHRGRQVTSKWCHLTADTEAELLAFATLIGMSPAWWQTCKRKCGPEGKPCIHWHFDVTQKRRADAVRAGAVQIDMRQMAAILATRRAAQK